tara:strand:+ start:571 stop:855 length:285 start_codon:yes stop_codon:yes gene_type:complete
MKNNNQFNLKIFKMKKVILILTAISLNLSCSSFDWNETNKKTFMDACSPNGDLKDYCECYLNQLIKDDISVLESANLSDEKVNEIAERCEAYIY